MGDGDLDAAIDGKLAVIRQNQVHRTVDGDTLSGIRLADGHSILHHIPAACQLEALAIQIVLGDDHAVGGHFSAIFVQIVHRSRTADAVAVLAKAVCFLGFRAAPFADKCVMLRIFIYCGASFVCGAGFGFDCLVFCIGSSIRQIGVFHACKHILALTDRYFQTLFQGGHSFVCALSTH